MAEFEQITEQSLASITAFTARDARQRLCAVSACYLAPLHAVEFVLNNGIRASIPVALIPTLEFARPDQLASLRVEGGGYGLHVPALDADISIPHLFEALLGSRTMSRALSRREASRANGKLGGRPRKAG
jgi:hypothetical protein